MAQFKDDSKEWIRLKDFKESNPNEVADYAVAHQLTEEPAFKWWVPHILKKSKQILSAIKKQYFRTHSKFGVELRRASKGHFRLTETQGPPSGATQLLRK